MLFKLALLFFAKTIRTQFGVTVEVVIEHVTCLYVLA